MWLAEKFRQVTGLRRMADALAQQTAAVGDKLATLEAQVQASDARLSAGLDARQAALLQVLDTKLGASATQLGQGFAAFEAGNARVRQNQVSVAAAIEQGFAAQQAFGAGLRQEHASIVEALAGINGELQSLRAAGDAAAVTSAALAREFGVEAGGRPAFMLQADESNHAKVMESLDVIESLLQHSELRPAADTRLWLTTDAATTNLRPEQGPAMGQAVKALSDETGVDDRPAGRGLVGIDVASVRALVGAVRRNLAGGGSGSTGTLKDTLGQLQGRLDGLSSDVVLLAQQAHVTVQAQTGRDSHLANDINGLLNAVLPLQHHLMALEGAFAGRLANTDNRIENLAATVTGINDRISAIEGMVANLDNRVANTRAVAAPPPPPANEHLNLLMARGTSAIVTRSLLAATQKWPAVGQPLTCPTLEQQMQLMQAAAPNNFKAWHAAYEAGIAEGLRTTDGNLSHEGHIGATYFRMFVNVHARGRVLDIGCGPLSVPSYLADWPVQALAGIDPQDPFEPHPFPFARTFAETVPWPDASFETVVIGTSLDHVYLLDRALAEIKRVLVPGGRLLIWTGIFDETAAYDPYGPTYTQPDIYHLFHPGRNWFYKLFEADYRLVERMPTVASAEVLAFELRARA